jgi:hypothetical protein
MDEMKKGTFDFEADPILIPPILIGGSAEEESGV